MKQNKRRKFTEALGEGLAELILTLICGAIGFGIFALFGIGEKIADENYELLVLVGLIAVATATAVLCALLRKLFRKSGNNMNENKNAINIILDTDVGADCDDMMALAYLSCAEREGKVKLRAVTHSNTCEAGVPAIRAFLGNAGYDIPVGHAAAEVAAYDKYATQIVERFGDESCYAPAEDAVTVLRRALSESYEVTLLAIGPMTNIAALLKSEADDVSVLDGVSLVRERCRSLVLMAGNFESEDSEWNVKLDISAMKTVIGDCPVPIYILPWECGNGMITGAHLLDASYPEDPLSLAFRIFPGTDKLGGRHSWDPAAAAFAVLGEGELFSLSEPAFVKVGDDGVTTKLPDAAGTHRIISVTVNEGESEADAKRRVAAHIDACAKKLFSEY